MANGTVHQLGTLFVNNVRQARPTRPWRPDTTPAGYPGAGNIPAYTSGNIEIRNSDADPNFRIQWIEVNDGGTRLLIADRCILTTVAWTVLNTQNLIFGREITIDGQRYEIRMLTGGTAARAVADTGGTPTNNEWDRLLTNEAGLSGLPVPTAADLASTGSAQGLTSVHNQMWNWAHIWTWCQETATANSATRAVRGSNSARRWTHVTATTAVANHAWRPCLVSLESAPLISDADRDLGSFTAPPSVPYTVAVGDGRNFSIFETLNGSQIRSLTNQVDGSFSADLAPHWAALGIGQHTLAINATNNVGTTTRTFTFTKSNTPPPPPLINSPANGRRIPGSGFVEFTPGRDAEGDTQTMTLQLATNAAFTAGLVEVTAGLQRLSGGNWVNATNVPDADIGSRFRLPYNGIPLNQARFIRVVANDGNASTPSAAVAVSTGDVLAFRSPPAVWPTQPASVFILLDKVVDPAADIQVFACNNALDTAPTWEDATADFLARRTYSFANTSKTAQDWAISVRVVISANTATGTIEVFATGKGVS
ncbi:MAG: hypothetical protein FWE19_00630 [Oscillospiraceae bacterium]|nr:hypothetical protein [Oscillospiraceae bacterium]